MSSHFHVKVVEPNGHKRTGAYASSRGSAEQEKRIEEEGVQARKVDIEECSQAKCFGGGMTAA